MTKQHALFRRPQIRAQFALPGELIVDSFAGGGGASTGIEAATGRPVDIAINYDPAAIAMHQANHPETKHFTENVWKVDPREACGSRPVGLAWFSPDCKSRFGLVMIHGEEYAITEIGMRMLQPHELYAAQGFPGDYIHDALHDGTPLTKTQQIHMVGNSVSPKAAEAVVAANVVADVRRAA